MNRSVLWLAIGALAIVAVVASVLYYRERNQSGIRIQINDNGVSIDGK